MKKSTKILLSSVAASILLIGCGGGGGSSSSGTSSTGTVSGTAADGRYVNMKVCLDTDFDGKCTISDKYEGYSGENGVYHISYKLSDKNASIAPIVAVAIPSTEEIIGNTKVPAGNVQLYAPRVGNNVNVTPLTTVIQAALYKDAISDPEEIKTKTKKLAKKLFGTENITSVLPEEDKALHATAAFLVSKIQNNPKQLVEELNITASDDFNKSFEDALADTDKKVYKQIVNMAENNASLLEESNLSVEEFTKSIVNLPDDVNITEALENNVSLNELVLKGYLNGVYNELSESDLLVTDEYNITDWNISQITKSLINDYNITGVNTLRDKVEEVNITVSGLYLNSVIKNYIKLQQIKAAVQHIDKKPANLEDFNDTYVYDVLTGNYIHFNENHTYETEDKNGTWEIFAKVLILDNDKYFIRISDDESDGFWQLISIDSDGNMEKKEYFINKERNYLNKGFLYKLLSGNYIERFNIPYKGVAAFVNQNLKIDGNSFYLEENESAQLVGKIEYSGNVIDNKTGNTVGTYMIDHSPVVELDVGDMKYYIALKNFLIDKIDYYVFKIDENNILKSVKKQSDNYDLSKSVFGKYYIPEVINTVNENNLTVLPIEKSDFSGKQFWGDEYVIKFNKDGTVIVGENEGRWKILDNKYLLITFKKTFSELQKIIFLALTDKNDHYLKFVLPDYERGGNGYGSIYFIPNTLSNVEFNESDVIGSLIDNFPVDTGIWANEDINGSTFEITYVSEESDYYMLYFDANGSMSEYIYEDYAIQNYTSNWEYKDGVIKYINPNDYSEVNYIIPFEKDGEIIKAYKFRARRKSKDSNKLGGIAIIEINKKSYPVKYPVGSLFGYDWAVTVAKYAGDKTYLNTYIDLNRGLGFQPLNHGFGAEVSTDFKSTNFVGTKFDLSDINESVKARFLVLSDSSLKNEEDNNVSLSAGVGISDAKIYFGIGEFDGNVKKHFKLGYCDYNYSNNDETVALDITTDGTKIYYHIYDENSSLVCIKSYDINDLNLSGKVSFNSAVFSIDANKTSEYPGITVFNFKTGINIDSFKDSLEFNPVNIDNTTVENKVLASDFGFYENDFLIINSDGSVMDVDENMTGEWNVSDNVLNITENGVTIYVAFEDINGSVAKIKGFDVEDGFFTDTVLLLKADENTVVDSADDFLALFDNTAEAIDINGTDWESGPNETIEFKSNGTFIDKWTDDGTEMNITGQWSVDQNVIMVDVTNSPIAGLKKLGFIYIGDDENGNNVFIGAGLDNEGNIINAFIKYLKEGK